MRIVSVSSLMFAACLLFFIATTAPFASGAVDDPSVRETSSRVAQEQPAAADRHMTAIRYLRQRVIANPDDSISLSKLGTLQLQQARITADHDEYQAAERVFRRLLDLDRDSLTGRVGLAYALIGVHQFQQALEHARAAQDMAPESPEILALLGDVYFAMGDYDEAEDSYQQLYDDENLTLQALSRVAQIHALRGRREEALQAMSEAYEVGQLLGEPSSSLAWCQTMLGDWMLHADRLDEAESHYAQALELDPSQHAASWRLAQIAFQREQWDRSEAILRVVINEFDREAYWIDLGRSLQAQGKQDEAERWFAKAEAKLVDHLERGDIGHVRDLANYWLLRETNIDRAVELAKLDLDETRHDVEAYALVARALHMAGQLDEAKQFAQSALQCGYISDQMTRELQLIAQ